eukprot:scaffold340_cov256-Pinguiococcus_pyrenoidosus.AAC.8
MNEDPSDGEPTPSVPLKVHKSKAELRKVCRCVAICGCREPISKDPGGPFFSQKEREETTAAMQASFSTSPTVKEEALPVQVGSGGQTRGSGRLSSFPRSCAQDRQDRKQRRLPWGADAAASMPPRELFEGASAELAPPFAFKDFSRQQPVGKHPKREDQEAMIQEMESQEDSAFSVAAKEILDLQQSLRIGTPLRGSFPSHLRETQSSSEGFPHNSSDLFAWNSPATDFPGYVGHRPASPSARSGADRAFPSVAASSPFHMRFTPGRTQITPNQVRRHSGSLRLRLGQATKDPTCLDGCRPSARSEDCPAAKS